jgi:hypothetical protein
MAKYIKYHRKFERTGTPLLDSIMNKRTFNHAMRVLSYFIETDRVKQEDLLKELFGKVATDKQELFMQKIGLIVTLIQIRQNYSIYLKNIIGKERIKYTKLLNTVPEFQDLRNRIDNRIANLEHEKENVSKIIGNIDDYNKNVKMILTTLKSKLESG